MIQDVLERSRKRYGILMAGNWGSGSLCLIFMTISGKSVNRTAGFKTMGQAVALDHMRHKIALGR